MRLPYKARFKYSINKTINFITSSLHGKAVENAENKIGEYFKKIFVKKAINTAFGKAEQYMNAVLQVQRAYRRNKCQYETVFKHFC